MLVNVINYNSVYNYPEELISIVCIYIIPSLRRIDIYWGYMQDTMMYCENVEKTADNSEYLGDTGLHWKIWERQVSARNI